MARGQPLQDFPGLGEAQPGDGVAERLDPFCAQGVAQGGLQILEQGAGLETLEAQGFTQFREALRVQGAGGGRRAGGRRGQGRAIRRCQPGGAGRGEVLQLPGQVRQSRARVRLPAVDGLFQASGPRHDRQGAQVTGVTAQVVQAPGGGLPIALGQVLPDLGHQGGGVRDEEPQQAPEELEVPTQGQGRAVPVDAGDRGEVVRRGWGRAGGLDDSLGWGGAGGLGDGRARSRGRFRGRSRGLGPEPLPQQGHHPLQVQGLGQQRVHARRQGGLPLLGHDGGTEGQDGQSGQAQFLADQAGGGQPVHDRHLHVHQHGVVALGLGAQGLQGLLAVLHQGGAGPFQGEHARGQFPVDEAVVHHQQVPSGQPWVGGGPGRWGGRGRRRRPGRDRRRPPEGQFEPEGAALARLALGADLATHQVHQALADGQAQPGAAEPAGDVAVGLGEGGEEAGQDLRGHADPRVADREAQAQALGTDLPGLDPDLDRAMVGELDGVADEVEEDLFQALGVAPQAPRQIGADDPQREALGPGRDPQQALELGQQRRQVEGTVLDLDPPGLDLGQVEDVVEEAQQGTTGAADLPYHQALIGGQAGPLQHLGETQHGVHGGADLVAHVGQEGALGLTGGLSGGLGGAQGLFLLALGADVAVDADQAPDLALGIAIGDGRGVNMAHPPARQAQAEDAVVGRALPHRRGEGGGRLVAILGMHAPLPEVVGQAVRAVLRRHLVPVAHARVPGELAAGDLPGPDADVGGLLGQAQQVEGLLDTPLIIYAFADVLDQREVKGALAGGDGHRGDGQADPDDPAVRAQVALVHLKARDLPGVHARHLVQFHLDVVRMGDAHPVDPGHLLPRAPGDGGEAGVDLEDPPAQGVGEGDAEGGLLEHGAEAGLGAGGPCQGLFDLLLGRDQIGGARRDLKLQAAGEGLDLRLGLFAGADILGGTAHAQRPAVGGAVDAPQRPDPTLGAIGQPDAVLGGVVRAGLEAMAHQGLDAGAVVVGDDGQKVRVTGRRAGRQGEVFPAQGRPVQRLGGEVPVPDAEVGAVDGELQPLLALAPLSLGLLALGDVQGGAQVAFEPALGIETGLGPVIAPAQAAVGSQDAVLQLVDGGVLQRGAEGALQPLRVLGREVPPQQLVVVRRGSRRLQPEDAILLVGPDRLPGGDDVFEGADMGDPLGLGESQLVLRQGLLSIPQFLEQGRQGQGGEGQDRDELLKALDARHRRRGDEGTDPPLRVVDGKEGDHQADKAGAGQAKAHGRPDGQRQQQRGNQVGQARLVGRRRKAPDPEGEGGEQQQPGLDDPREWRPFCDPRPAQQQRRDQ